MIDKEESTRLQAIRALERLANNLQGLSPGIPRLLEDLQLTAEEHYFLLYGIALISKAIKRRTERQGQSSR